VRSRCADGDTDSDLGRALAHIGDHHPIQSDRRQHHGGAAKPGDQERIETRAREGLSSSSPNDDTASPVRLDPARTLSRTTPAMSDSSEELGTTSVCAATMNCSAGRSVGRGSRK
jgi:hypothetical protein